MMLKRLFAMTCSLLVAPPEHAHGTLAKKADIALEEKLGQYISGNTVFVEGRQKLHRKTIIQAYRRSLHEP